LRVLRRGVGDAGSIAVIGDVPVYDAKSGKAVTFAEYMEDFAATYIGHPVATVKRCAVA
jgi:hypothetical protein